MIRRRAEQIAVLGGGIAGLAAAHALLDSGARVTLYEAADQFGGLGASFRYGDTWLDRFYHVLLPGDRDLLDLLDRLGMSDRVYWREASLGFLYRHRLYPLAGPLDLLRFDAVPFHDRLRLGLTSLYAGMARPDRLDDVTAAEWLTRLSGQRAFARLWRPLLQSKFGDAYGNVPALWYWSSFNREKGTRREVKGSLRGGYRGVAEVLVESIASRGGELLPGTEVARLDLDADGKPLVEASGSTRSFDRLVATIPPAALARIADGKVADALEGIERVDYQGVVNVLVLLSRSVSPHYWIPVVDSGAPFQGIVETTRVLDLADTGGHHLVYLLSYLHRNDQRYGLEPAELRASYLDALFRLFPDISAADVQDSFVFKAPFVEPLYSPGYLQRKPPAELIPDRVYLATTAQIYPRVTSWNSSTALAREVVSRIVAEPCPVGAG